MQLSAISLALTRAGYSIFTPSSIFTSGVNGVWYDPSDFTRYMSSLGPELVTNGNFSAGTTGWAISANGTATVSSGVLTLTNGSFGFQRITQGFATTVGKTYRINCTNLSGNSRYSVSSANDYGQNVLAVQSVSGAVFTATTTTSYIVLSCYTANNGDTATFDDVSVCELTAVDTATLFQNAAGTLPVTAVEQPAGLMLDKSKGLVLGSELVTNGDFSNGTTGWSATPATTPATLSVVGGELQVTSAEAVSGAQQLLSTTAGKFYKVTATLKNGTATDIKLRAVSNAVSGTILGESVVVSSISATQVTVYFFAATTTTAIYLRVNGAGTYGYFDNISVRELPGNHAFNSSGNSANFPVLSARYNLLTKTEQFDDAGVWALNSGLKAFGSGSIVNTTETLDPVGTNTAEKLVEVSGAITSAAVFLVSNVTAVSGINYTSTVYVKSAGRRYCAFYANGVPLGAGAFFDLQELVATTIGASNIARSIVDVGNGWRKLSISFQSTTASVGLSLNITDNGSTNNYTGDGTSGIYIWGADLRVANDALNQPSYQRVNTPTDYDTVGFKPYLRFNGTNQWLQTNSLDFTNTAQMFVSAGVRKLSDATSGVIAELSTGGSVGSFLLNTPSNAGNSDYQAVLYGNGAGVQRATSFSAPITNVVSASYNFAGSAVTDEISIRVNGATPTLASSGTPSTTAAFGNYPLYIGARGGSSLWFNGRLYQLIVAGKQASASEIGQTEAFINQKTGAY